MTDPIEQRIRAAWDEVRRFMDSSDDPKILLGPQNPQRRLAPGLLDIYLERRPSPEATRALESAIVMWSNLGSCQEVEDAVSALPRTEDIWHPIASSILRAFRAGSREDDGIALLERLVTEVVPRPSRSALLFTLGHHRLDQGDVDRARAAFEQVIEWNASDWHVKQARGYLYELDALNVGQPAPDFSVLDRQGNQLHLRDCRGRPVVLHFWGTTCGACSALYPDLRALHARYSPSSLAMVGASDDKDVEVADRTATNERLTWPQICEGSGWDDRLFRLYNITAIPAVYVMDPQGAIALKFTGNDRGADLISAVAALVA